MLDLLLCIVLGWILGVSTFFLGFFFGAIVYNTPKKNDEKKERAR